MSNKKTTPSGWGTKASLPSGWGEKKESNNDNVTVQEEAFLEGDFLEKKILEETEDNMKKLPEPEREEKSEEKPKKKKGAIVLGILLGVVLLAVTLTGVYFFNKNSNSSEKKVNEKEKQPDKETVTETDEKEEDIYTTDGAIDILSAVDGASSSVVNPDDCLGYWNTKNNKEEELTILSVTDDSVVFTLWYYRLNFIENVTAKLNGNIATFDWKEYGQSIRGTLIFHKDYITVNIEESEVANMPASTKTYNERHEQWWMKYGYGEEGADTTNSTGGNATDGNKVVGQGDYFYYENQMPAESTTKPTTKVPTDAPAETPKEPTTEPSTEPTTEPKEEVQQIKLPALPATLTISGVTIEVTDIKWDGTWLIFYVKNKSDKTMETLELGFRIYDNNGAWVKTSSVWASNVPSDETAKISRCLDDVEKSDIAEVTFDLESSYIWLYK